MMYLWLDDVRPAPKGQDWIVATSAEEAIAILKNWKERGTEVDLASLDHDLGGVGYNHCAICEAGKTPEQIYTIIVHGCHHQPTGRVVVEWMRDNNFWPRKIIMHSWNPEGALRMARIAGEFTEVLIQPFKAQR